MCSPIAGCSTSDMTRENQNNNEDLNELREFQGINVWGEHHEILEQQALKELEIFNKGGKEDGECSDNESLKESEIEIPTNKGSLDINLYIQRQQELKKRQVHKRSLLVSEKSKNAADEISRRQSIIKPKQGKKRKGSSSKEYENVSKSIKSDSNSIVCDNNIELKHVNDASGSEYAPSELDSEYEPGFNEAAKVKPKQKKYVRKKAAVLYKKVIDDGNVKCYNKRLDEYYKQLENDNIKKLDDNSIEEDIEIKPGFKISAKIWNMLYGYQQEGVEWLWELQKKCTGGLLGDEMGLGKTVQIIAFLYALNYSRIVSKYGRYTGLGPTLIVAPSTVIHQWVKHFHDWAPEFRVAVLHQSGSYEGNKMQLIKDIMKSKGIIITTYQSILKYKGVLSELDWHYLILDEGHKIRNSQSKISCAVKEFRTPHKILISGSPMQNNLQELWSLFDFINPGMLGSLTVFLEHFANPIMQGGYTNATSMQEALALSMATALKDMITPFLLRRAKQDVKQEICLPNKSEQVLFCSLTHEQRDLYKGYLMSEQVSMVLGRGGKTWFSNNYTRSNVLVGITTLRKICNHPDIYLNETDAVDENAETQLEDRFGYYKRSGKMIVVSALLKIWKRQKHRVLLFTQSRSMITIFQEFLGQQGYKYVKMDGNTSIGARQPLIEKFNKDESIDVFLLTTRVGGLGVNLTGANRVIIFDPDWNPATDTQARERAWRIGQEKQVTIYRLLSAGTIEEKMYQRQVWKQLLSNKVLLDPKTQRFFRTSDLHDLFSLQESTDTINPETANIFQNSRISLQQKINEKKATSGAKDESKIEFSDDKIEKMKRLATQISKNISTKNSEIKSVNKTELQMELEEERLKKLQEKEVLKKMTPTELRNYNREKLEQKEEIANKLDDCETDISFTKALVISEKSADLYNEVKGDKHKIDEVTKEYTDLTKIFSIEKSKLKDKKHKKKHRPHIDKSGKVEGEKIDGLLKMEIKRDEKKKENKVEKQDNYVLEQLFSKRGVHTALQHDVIMQSGYKGGNSMKVHSETQMKTDLALQALKKSRVRSWRY